MLDRQLDQNRFCRSHDPVSQQQVVRLRGVGLGNGSAVFVCSLTTIIGYGSLLVSDNQAIRAFGTASLVGEVCCLATALIVAPAVLGLGGRRPQLAPSSSGALRAVAI